MLGRQTLDEVFKSMCSTRNRIEKLERSIDRKPDYCALRKFQDDPDFNEQCDHIFNMLTPLAQSEETALCCILRMRESEVRVLQQLHSKLQSEDAPKLILEADINSRRKVIEILKYALKLNQQESMQGIPLNSDDETIDLDTDAANMCQRIVQRRLNYLELIADGTINDVPQRQLSSAPKLSNLHQRLAETAKNVERRLNSLGTTSEMSLHDLEPSSVAASPCLGDKNPGHSSDDGIIQPCTDPILSEVLKIDDLNCTHPDEAGRLLSDSLSSACAQESYSSRDRNLTSRDNFEFLTAIPRKNRPNHLLSTANINAKNLDRVQGDVQQKCVIFTTPPLDANFKAPRPMKAIAPFAMVKQFSHQNDFHCPRTSTSSSSVSTQTFLEFGTACIAKTPTVSPIPLSQRDTQLNLKHSKCSSPSTIESTQMHDLDSYSESKSTVLKVRRSSFDQATHSNSDHSNLPIRYIYADLVHSSKHSPSECGANDFIEGDVMVSRPRIAHVPGSETVRSPRKYEAQINRMRSASVGRVHASAPLFRESHFPVMKQGSHLELQSLSERFDTGPSAAVRIHEPLGWV